MNRQSIERYACGARALAAAVTGLSSQELRAFPVPGTWSIQQIVFHLMDSDRMKRMIAMENPLLVGYDETAFAKSLPYEQLDAGVACEVFEKSRQLTAEILRRLPEEAFERSGIHSERGRITLGEYIV